MRWFNARLIVGLAPLLSLADAVDGAPAGAIAAGTHRRAPVENPDSPWHRRYAASKRQVGVDLAVDPPIPIEGEFLYVFYAKILFLFCFFLGLAGFIRRSVRGGICPCAKMLRT